MLTGGPPSVAGLTDNDGPCPFCGETGVLLSDSLPRARGGWSCAACRVRWARSFGCPQLFLDRLTAMVSRRSLLRKIVALAGESPALIEGQLRFRLLVLAAHAVPPSPGWPLVESDPSSTLGDCSGPDPAPTIPAGRRLRDSPGSAPGGQSVPASAGHRSSAMERKSQNA
jgi:hypothetical protein